MAQKRGFLCVHGAAACDRFVFAMGLWLQINDLVVIVCVHRLWRDRCGLDWIESC